MTRVVIADDQDMVRSGLRLILELAGVDVVGEAADGEQAVSVVLEHDPDVVLMDLRMPHVDGVEATRRLTSVGVRSRVLVLTTFDLDRHVHDALAAGACGFVLKDATAAELVSAVERTAAGESVFAAGVLDRIVHAYLGNGPPREPTEQATRLLSSRELEVLALVAAGHDNGEIAGRLHLSPATVKSHVRHILAKLEVRDRISAVLWAHTHGVGG